MQEQAKKVKVGSNVTYDGKVRLKSIISEVRIRRNLIKKYVYTIFINNNVK